jgi:hypothetical protein
LELPPFALQFAAMTAKWIQTKIGTVVNLLKEVAGIAAFVAFEIFFWKFRNLKTSPSCYW